MKTKRILRIIGCGLLIVLYSIMLVADILTLGGLAWCFSLVASLSGWAVLGNFMLGVIAIVGMVFFAIMLVGALAFEGELLQKILKEREMKYKNG